VLARAGQIGEHVVLAGAEDLGGLREARRQALGDGLQLGPRGGLVGLGEDRPDERGDHGCGMARDVGQDVAQEVDPTDSLCQPPGRQAAMATRRSSAGS
jgi:hypothetical protein